MDHSINLNQVQVQNINRAHQMLEREQMII